MSQLICSAIRDVAAKYSALLTAKKPWTKVVFRPGVASLQGGESAKDFRLDPQEKQVDVKTLEGRLKGLPYHTGAPQQAMLENGWNVGGARLCVRKKGVFLEVSLDRQGEILPAEQAPVRIGVDRGQNYLAVAAGPDGKCQFFGGGEVKQKCRQYREVRESLQRKKAQTDESRSIRRVLKRLSGKERRYMTDVNHCVSKEIVAFASRYPGAVIVLEDLKGIRERTRHRKEQQSDFHRWAYAQLEQFIRYKAQQAGLAVALVDPRHTSKGCSRCGNVADGQRNRHNFKCQACGFQLHADLNAARNIAQRAVPAS
jgi:IS605 OrfB family transposase